MSSLTIEKRVFILPSLSTDTMHTWVGEILKSQHFYIYLDGVY